jgi:DNA-binding transcriptional regulator GbsR (MarR family)
VGTHRKCSLNYKCITTKNLKTFKNFIITFDSESLKLNIMDTVKQVLDTLKSARKPLSAGQISELSGIERKEVDKAMKKLKTDGLIVSPKVCYWEPAK